MKIKALNKLKLGPHEYDVGDIIILKDNKDTFKELNNKYFIKYFRRKHPSFIGGGMNSE